MIITFQNGQYFDPMNGWCYEKPEISKDKTTDKYKNIAIDESMAYVIDDRLQELIESMKAKSELKAEENINTNNVTAQTYVSDEDISYYMDKMQYSLKGCNFNYEGNKMTVSVNLYDPFIPMEFVGKYEEKRNTIIGFKDFGYSDEAVKMLLNELDKTFINTACKGITTQFESMGYSEEEAKEMSKRFNEEYLNVRGNTGSYKDDAILALKNLRKQGFAEIDLFFGTEREIPQKPRGIIATDEDRKMLKEYIKETSAQNMAKMNAAYAKLLEEQDAKSLISDDDRILIARGVKPYILKNSHVFDDIIKNELL